MSFFNAQNSPLNGCTSIIHRVAGGISGVREVFDNASTVAVSSFPMAQARDLITAKLSVPACYILASHDTVYFGETNNFYRRLCEHLSDSSKSFAREVFVITGPKFDKTTALYLQWALDRAAEKAGLVAVQKGVNPRLVHLSDWQRDTLDRVVADAERLLFDAGFRGIHSNCAGMRPVVKDTDPQEPDAHDITGDNCEADDAAPMEIGVVATPHGVPEFELDYVNLWTRGYSPNEGFVVTAGSEIRNQINASVNRIVFTRRDELAEAGVLAAIPGLSDRMRLTVSVGFPSMAIAAKIITGAHVAGTKWIPLRNQQPFVIAA